MDSNGIIFDDEDISVDYDNIYNNFFTVVTDSTYINKKNLKEYTITYALKYIQKEGNKNVPKSYNNIILSFISLYLYKNGGVYVEQKSSINKKIYDNIKKNTDFVLFINKQKQIDEKIFISKPGCKYWLDVYNKIITEPNKCPSQILWDCIYNKDYKYTLSELYDTDNCSDANFYNTILIVLVIIIVLLLLYMLTNKATQSVLKVY